jgi:hypothetical protein
LPLSALVEIVDGMRKEGYRFVSAESL